MDRYSFLVLPVSQVPPFEISKPYVTKIDGRPLETYIDWMRSCYYISVTGLPAISVPCGFTPEGWPVGVQIVGRHRNELELLQLAYAFEQATGFGRRRPDLTEAQLAQPGVNMIQTQRYATPVKESATHSKKAASDTRPDRT